MFSAASFLGAAFFIFVTYSTFMKCRMCGACCIAPSISSKIPGMPDGKPANVRCVNLDKNNKCRIFNSINRPKVCSEYKPDSTFCGKSFEEAMDNLLKIQ